MNSTSHIFRWYTFVRHTQDDKLRINSRAFPFDKVKNSPRRSVYKWIEMFKHTNLLLPKKIQVSALCWKVFVDGVRGLPRAYPWTLYGERCYSNMCQLLQHVKKWTEGNVCFSVLWDKIFRVVWDKGVSILVPKGTIWTVITKLHINIEKKA